MDAPRKANSGHTGTALALAPLAHVLFTRVLRYDVGDLRWEGRDRFILSAGHASILLYTYLCLLGFGLELADLESFRQWQSATPGHPEVGHTPGVEVTTGPLGQGFANAVGMAIAESHLRAREGTAGHHTYVIAGDGCLEEGISHEAASLAGHLGLGRLICVFDDNRISIDGPTSLAVSDDTVMRFRSYGWHVDDVGEIAEDLDALHASIERAKEVNDRPSMIVLRSHIGWPSPHLTDTAAAHGEVFPPDEIAATKLRLGLDVDQPFFVPEDVAAFYRAAGRARRVECAQPDHAHRIAPDIDRLRGALPTFDIGSSIATRSALARCLNQFFELLPNLMLGSADLTGNTGVAVATSTPFSRENPSGRQIHFGIREHAMGAVMNGMALHGGVLPIGGTFFVFSDYMRPAVRLAALSEAHVIYSFTHDSIGLGEDGPTHQPIEHLASLRAMPGLVVIRPADANETVFALAHAIVASGPIALVLSRQNLPVLKETAEAFDLVRRGGYVLVSPSDARSLDIVLVATGSEVALCLEAAHLLERDGIGARVVSLCSWEWFHAQDEEYREAVLPRDVATLAVEAGSSFGWERYADACVGIDSFGSSAPSNILFEVFGFTVEGVADRARALVSSDSRARGAR